MLRVVLCLSLKKRRNEAAHDQLEQEPWCSGKGAFLVELVDDVGIIVFSL